MKKKYKKKLTPISYDIISVTLPRYIKSSLQVGFAVTSFCNVYNNIYTNRNIMEYTTTQLFCHKNIYVLFKTSLYPQQY